MLDGITRLRNYAENLKDMRTHYYMGFDLERIANDIERETMPRPLLEDGEPVNFGDEIDTGKGVVFNVKHIDMYANGSFDLCGDGSVMVYRNGETVKRPAVLDADGVPVEPFDEVWEVGRSSAYTVQRVDAEHGRVYLVDEDASEGYSGERALAPGMLTHKKPEPPDSWERILSDAKKDFFSYFGRNAQIATGALCKEAKWTAATTRTSTSFADAVSWQRRRPGDELPETVHLPSR